MKDNGSENTSYFLSTNAQVVIKQKQARAEKWARMKMPPSALSGWAESWNCCDERTWQEVLGAISLDPQ